MTVFQTTVEGTSRIPSFISNCNFLSWQASGFSNNFHFICCSLIYYQFKSTFPKILNSILQFRLGSSVGALVAIKTCSQTQRKNFILVTLNRDGKDCVLD